MVLALLEASRLVERVDPAGGSPCNRCPLAGLCGAGPREPGRRGGPVSTGWPGAR